jgi:predicted transport protein
MEKDVVDYDFQSQLLEERKNKISERSNKMKFDEEFHTKGRAEWSVDLYLELDKFIMNLKTGVRKEFLESYIKYSYNGLLFCYVVLRQKETLRLWAKIPYTSLGAVPLFVRDYEPVSRRVGVMIAFDDQREFLQNKEAMVDIAFGIVKKAFQGIASRKVRKRTPLERIKEVEQIERKVIEPVKPIEIIRPSSINISVDDNGYMSINLKLHKSQKELLNRILQETILK